jgi:hypothetical protein
MTPLTLRPIALGKIRHGGYVVGYDGTVPVGARLHLGLPDLNNAIDVTGHSKDDLLNANNLPLFLACIGRNRTWWGGQGRCRLYVKVGTNAVAESNEQTFSCPVRPLVGRASPELGRGDNGPLLRYTGTPPNYADGRYLFVPAIDNCHYFAYGGRFETDDNKRGFNCITYVGAVFGVDVNSGAMSSFGTELAQHCGCTATECENKSLADAKAFLASRRVGTYFMWSAHHIVLVVNGVVHEFREKYGRYNAQSVAAWSHGDNHWWVRKSLRQF